MAKSNKKGLETADDNWLTKLMQTAIDRRASDVHFEPGNIKFSIRLRIDGVLQDLETSAIKYYQQMASKIKVESQMDIAKTRVPQDGHFTFPYGEREYNIRVSTFPTIFGEAIVLRILNREDLLIRLSDLGFDAEQLEELQSLIHRPYGMLLITGPSASGKTTLLNSCIQKLNTSENNIVTIEDPVELYFENIRQSQVNQYSEFDFASALRSVIRQDPDIMMVGEIRDRETAQISIQAALTGRLVLSTFHTFDIYSIINRLMEMGISRSVLGHSLSGLVSTRLVRKICEDCKVPYQPTPKEKGYLPEDITKEHTLYKGKGCEKCNNTGYYKRTGIFEIIPFDENIKYAIIENGNINQALQQKRYKTLRESAMDKIRQGITTPEEVFKTIGKGKE